MSLLSAWSYNKSVPARSHKAPSAIAQAVWRMAQQQQFPVPEIALLLAMAPQRVARIVDAMHKRQVERWRMT